MSEDEEDPSTPLIDPRDRLPTMHGRRDFEMDVIGWLVFIVMLVVLIPLLPAIVLAVVLARLLRLTGDRHLSWGRPGA